MQNPGCGWSISWALLLRGGGGADSVQGSPSQPLLPDDFLLAFSNSRTNGGGLSILLEAPSGFALEERSLAPSAVLRRQAARSLSLSASRALPVTLSLAFFSCSQARRRTSPGPSDWPPAKPADLRVTSPPVGDPRRKSRSGRGLIGHSPGPLPTLRRDDSGAHWTRATSVWPELFPFLAAWSALRGEDGRSVFQLRMNWGGLRVRRAFGVSVRRSLLMSLEISSCRSAACVTPWAALHWGGVFSTSLNTYNTTTIILGFP